MKNATDEELINAYKNARNTGAGCGGHHKAEMNELFYKKYREELEARGLDIPSNQDCYDTGTFNGLGSY